LIEVAIAMGLLAVAAVASVGLLTAMLRTNRDARLRTVAATLARQTIDELISSTDVAQTKEMMFEAMDAAGYCSGGYAAGYVCNEGAATFGGLTRVVTIGPPADQMVPVVIDISWERAAGTNHLKFTFTLSEPN
jgi:Tfp pilus assembly protein PilV